MKLLARLFGAISEYFESRATAKQLAQRIAAMEMQQAQMQAQIAQVRVDVAKCKIMVGLNQFTEVSAE